MAQGRLSMARKVGRVIKTILKVALVVVLSILMAGINLLANAGDTSCVASYVPANADADTTTYATDRVSGTSVANVFDDAKGDLAYPSRPDWEGTLPAHDGEPIQSDVSTWGGEMTTAT